MSFAERVVRWNRGYDNIPEQWRFQLVVWALLVIGAINMLLTVAAHFPFALLLVLAIIVIAALRVPYVLNWVASSPQAAADAKFQIEGANWLVDLNRRYDAMPDMRRFWVYPVVLLIGGAVNMVLTIAYGFPFGLLFLLVLLCLVAIRAPYAAGWYRSEQPQVAGPHGAGVEHTPMPAIASEPEAPSVPPATNFASPADRVPDDADPASHPPDHAGQTRHPDDPLA
ncbi:hypothetical protein [Rhodopila sp.]|uniref:hypothetical protein n=1 Tax=Rhodopila sp. TaxID=2480087 RepID=UPI003D11A8FC